MSCVLSVTKLGMIVTAPLPSRWCRTGTQIAYVLAVNILSMVLAQYLMPFLDDSQVCASHLISGASYIFVIVKRGSRVSVTVIVVFRTMRTPRRSTRLALCPFINS